MKKNERAVSLNTASVFTLEDAVISAIKSRFDEFLELYYRDALNDIMVSFPEKRSLAIKIDDLAKFDPNMASELVNNTRRK